MKKIIFSLLFLITTSLISVGQPWINLNFNDGIHPATGWTVTSNPDSWFVIEGSELSDPPYELWLFGFPNWEGDSRFVSPSVDLTGKQNVLLTFRSALSVLSSLTPMRLGVATRHQNGPWHEIWHNSGESFGAQEIMVKINNEDINNPDFQICFFYNGPIMNIYYWAIDKVLLTEGLSHDMGIISILNNEYCSPGDQYTPKAAIVNFGHSTENVQVTATITNFAGAEVYNQTKSINNLVTSDTAYVEFPNFTLEDDLYKIKVVTNIANDGNNKNDTLSKSIYTYNSTYHNVLIEISTATWCVSCPSAAHGINDLLSNNYNIAVLEYHGNDDYANAFSSARMNYYNINGFPTTIFNGANKIAVGIDPNHSLYPTYKPIVDKVLQQRTPIDMLFKQMIVKDDKKAYIKVEVNKTAKYMPYNDLKLHLCRTRSNIPNNWGGGLTELDFVLEEMYPDASGTQFSFNEANTFEKEFIIDTQGLTNIDDIEIVAFIQNNSNKRVLNAIKAPISSFFININDPITTKSPIKISPNPIHNKFNVYFNNSGFIGKTNFTLINSMGKEVYNFKEEYLENDNMVISLSLDQFLSKGIYFLRINSNNKTSVHKVVIQ